MTIVGKKNEKIIPVGYLMGSGGKIPITSFRGSFAVGSIPTCTVGVPIEALSQIPDEQTDNLFSVVVGSSDGAMSTMFKGYVSGDDSDTTAHELSAGVALVHQARDLDQHRISAPNLHPSTVDDFTYSINGTGTGSPGGRFGGQTYYGGSGRLPDQIIAGLIAAINANKSARIGGKPETAGKAIAALGTIKSINGTPNGAIGGGVATVINEFCRRMAEASFTAKSSVWNTITAIFSQFGIHLICAPDGSIYASADMAGFKPAGGNNLDGDYIASHRKTSILQRNIKEVNIIANHILKPSASGVGAKGTIVRYPPGAGANEAGASLALLLPGWLNPIKARGGGAAGSLQAYAKMMYYLERNKLRTMSVTGPLAPKAIAGTTSVIEPFSAVHAKSGSIGELKKKYAGYCYQINHVMDVKARILQTTFFFRNVSKDGSETVDAHPLFDDVKPFSWQ